MEHPSFDTDYSVFSVGDTQPEDEPEDPLDFSKLPQIEIREEEWASWLLYIRCRNTRSHMFTRDATWFAEDWARYMQHRIANGEAIADIYVDSANRVNTCNQPYSVIYRAVGILARHWEHGAELRSAFDSYHDNEEGQRRQKEEELESNIY